MGKRALSRGGKEILLKTVAQALPNYAMSTFLIPQQICSEMELIMNKFWWRGSNSSKGIHWLNWDRMCEKKSTGGLGFRKLQEFNIALLCKQGWRLVVKPHSLVGRIYKARYYPDGTFLSAN